MNNTDRLQNRLISIEPASHYLGRSVHSVRYLVRTKQVPFVRIGSRIFFDQKALDEFISQRTTPAREVPTPDAREN